MKGCVYHIDPAGGDDANDGLAPSRPCKTYAGREFTGGETRNITERIYFRDNLFTDCGLSAYESREPAREAADPDFNYYERWLSPEPVRLATRLAADPAADIRQ